MTRAAAPVAEAAPAKLNLYLHVVGRRDDGYHLLDSLVAFAEFGDRVEARPAAALTLALDGPHAAELPADDGNLVLRAARALAEAGGVAPRAALRLEKAVPVASGLGGGSADAAAALRALVRLWGLALDEAALRRLGLGLGADVPVCLYGRPALVRGIGEALAPAPPVPAAPVVLVNPGRAVATPAVFAGRTGGFSEPGRYGGADGPDALADALRGTRNDLTDSALRLAPEIAEALAALEASGALLARMSGSGATCFGLYRAQADAEAAARRIAAARPGWWVAASRLAR